MGNMKKRIALFITGVSIVLTACGSADKSASEVNSVATEYAIDGGAYESYDVVQEEGNTTIQTVDGKQYEKKLVYTCDLSMETLEYDATMVSIKQAISHFSGFLESESCHTGNYGAESTRYCSLTVRVPSTKYEAFLQEISKSGSVLDMNARVENITQQYYDTETRIKALKIQEDRLLTMMTECDNVADMIVVEQRLTEVQSEMERYQTQLNVMQTEVDYSTVNINVDEVARITVHEDSVWERFLSVAQDSWEFFIGVLSVLGTAIVYMFPFAVVSGVILFIIHLLHKGSKQKKE